MTQPTKLIRECRMGLPKTFKTGGVVGTYPTPLLYLGFDIDGITVIPPRSHIYSANEIKLSLAYEDVERLNGGQMTSILARPQQPKCLSVEYCNDLPLDLNCEMGALKSQDALNKLQGTNPRGDLNLINDHIRAGKPFPWRTVVLDSGTGYMSMVMSWMASYNAAAMNDARVWAFQVGEKVKQIIQTVTRWPCHVVFIFHTLPPEPDLDGSGRGTGQLLELPNIYSKAKDVVGGLFSQYMYATKVGAKPVLKTQDHMYVKGLGCRWPAGLPAEIAPDYFSIYGKELSNG